MTNHHRIVLEQGKKKVFATAIDWPGWSRSGKSDTDALDVLISYADRYQIVAEMAEIRGVRTTAAHPEVIETLQGSGATDFGVPDKVAQADHKFMTEAECERQIRLLEACWDYFDEVAGKVSAEMRKGPRGGGRDRDEIVLHTLEADRGYARQIGVKTTPGHIERPDGVKQHREDVVQAIREQNENESETKWPLRYFIRRAAWHMLDHAWEMEDKDLTSPGSSPHHSGGQ